MKNKEIIFLVCLLSIGGCTDNIEKTKQTPIGSDKKITFSELLDNRGVCETTEWVKSKENDNTEVVIYKCKMKGATQGFKNGLPEMLTSLKNSHVDETSKIESQQKVADGIQALIEFMKTEANDNNIPTHDRDEYKEKLPIAEQELIKTKENINALNKDLDIIISKDAEKIKNAISDVAMTEELSWKIQDQKIELFERKYKLIFKNKKSNNEFTFLSPADEVINNILYQKENNMNSLESSNLTYDIKSLLSE